MNVLTKAARNMCDTHRRRSDAIAERAQIEGERQARLNAKEWIRRAWRDGVSYEMMLALYERAALELRPYGRTIDDLHIGGYGNDAH